MNGSLGKHPSTFHGLTLRSARVLVEVLQRSKLRTKRQVRSVFSKTSEHFDAALTFLIRVGVVQERDGDLAFRSAVPTGRGPDIEAWIFSRLLRARNRYRSEMFRYLRRYRFDGGDLVYQPQAHHVSHESGVRNFLMEMGVVRHDRVEATYHISQDYIYLYAQARKTPNAMSPQSLAKLLRAKEVLGLEAEKAVIKFEQKRLGPDMSKNIEHVSLRNAAAGYDIKSFTVADDEEGGPRFIEVKAVSANSMSFYWSSNEIAVAEILRDSYFLYLLPVVGKGTFDLSLLRIISDPHKVVLESQSEWMIETDGVRCSLQIQPRATHKSTKVLQSV